MDDTDTTRLHDAINNAVAARLALQRENENLRALLVAAVQGYTETMLENEKLRDKLRAAKSQGDIRGS